MTTGEPPTAGRAPGELALVQEFVNSEDIEAGEDAIATPDALRSLLRDLLGVRVTPSEKDLSRALDLRDALRTLASSNNGEPFPPSAGAILDQVARRAGLVAGFGPDGKPREVPTAAGVDGALGELLAIVHRAMRDGTWSRLKACHEHGCRWLFYDHSRNRSGIWCSMALCGTRAKMRTYRARLQTTTPPASRRRR